MKVFILILLIAPMFLLGQSALTSNKQTIQLERETSVDVFNKDDCIECFYYLPTNLNVSFKDGEPEVSLVKWEEENGLEAGAILHFLISWGITRQQENQLSHALKLTLDRNATVLGSLSVEPVTTHDYFFGSSDIVKLLNERLTATPPLATTPGSKMAFSFRFYGNDLDILNDFIENMKDDQARLELKYSYRLDYAAHSIILSLKVSDILMYIL